MTVTHEEHADRIRTEYGQFRASQNINLNGVRAFAKGHPVPASFVRDGIVRDDQVEAAPQPEPTPTPEGDQPEGNARTRSTTTERT